MPNALLKGRHFLTHNFSRSGRKWPFERDRWEDFVAAHCDEKICVRVCRFCLSTTEMPMNFYESDAKSFLTNNTFSSSNLFEIPYQLPIGYSWSSKQIRFIGWLLSGSTMKTSFHEIFDREMPNFTSGCFEVKPVQKTNLFFEQQAGVDPVATGIFFAKNEELPNWVKSQ